MLHSLREKTKENEGKQVICSMGATIDQLLSLNRKGLRVYLLKVFTA